MSWPIVVKSFWKTIRCWQAQCFSETVYQGFTTPIRWLLSGHAPAPILFRGLILMPSSGAVAKPSSLRQWRSWFCCVHVCVSGMREDRGTGEFRTRYMLSADAVHAHRTGLMCGLGLKWQQPTIPLLIFMCICTRQLDTRAAGTPARTRKHGKNAVLHTRQDPVQPSEGHRCMRGGSDNGGVALEHQPLTTRWFPRDQPCM